MKIAIVSILVVAAIGGGIYWAIKTVLAIIRGGI